MSRATARKILVDAFEETAEVLNGIFIVHEVDDKVVWQIAKSLNVIYRKAREELRSAGPGGGRASSKRKPEPHPAIVELLAQLHRDQEELRREEVGSP